MESACAFFLPAKSRKFERRHLHCCQKSIVMLTVSYMVFAKTWFFFTNLHWITFVGVPPYLSSGWSWNTAIPFGRLQYSPSWLSATKPLSRTIWLISGLWLITRAATRTAISSNSQEPMLHCWVSEKEEIIFHSNHW